MAVNVQPAIEPTAPIEAVPKPESIAEPRTYSWRAIGVRLLRKDDENSEQITEEKVVPCLALGVKCIPKLTPDRLCVPASEWASQDVGFQPYTEHSRVTIHRIVTKPSYVQGIDHTLIVDQKILR